MPSGKRHYRLTLVDAYGAHTTALKYGGAAGVLNPPLIASAIQRPYTGYYRPIYKKAAALVESAARNHGFADGNKRTCLLLLGLLLDRSGYELAADGSPATGKAVEELIVQVANGEKSFEEIAAWMKVNVVKKVAE